MLKRDSKKGQGTVEFMVMFATVLFFFIMFMAIVQNNVQSKNEKKQNTFLHNTALGARDEISLAAESSEGYYRNFYVPTDILGKNYEINITDSRIFVFMGDQIFSYRISNVTGNLKKGENVIFKENGKIYLNQ